MIGNSMPRLLRSIVFPEPSQPFCCACEIVAPKKRRGKIDCAVLLLFSAFSEHQDDDQPDDQDGYDCSCAYA